MHTQVSDSDSQLQRIITGSIGHGPGIYGSDDPVPWYPKLKNLPDERIANKLGDKPKIFEVQLLDPSDVERWNRRFAAYDWRNPPNDFPAKDQVKLLRELSFEAEDKLGVPDSGYY